ncbi:MAG TPA: hypothetical protein VE732_07730, partial [Nitrososphaera sp.]|nr:hypothetical protein [Nitrososphaera sp.]
IIPGDSTKERKIIKVDMKSLKKKGAENIVLEDYDTVEVISRSEKKRVYQPFINPYPSWPNPIGHRL